MTDWQILIAAYVLGSIPFGLILTRIAGLGDIRAIGSGNIGATNVLRTGKKALAAMTLLLDALKGTVAVLLAFTFQPENALQLAPLAGLVALLGHMFPVWLGFKGGKGVATSIGIWLGLAPFIALLMVTAWLAGAYATKRSSMGAMACILVLPAAAGAFAPAYTAIALATMGLVGIQHRDNIRRVIAGTEPRIGEH